MISGVSVESILLSKGTSGIFASVLNITLGSKDVRVRCESSVERRNATIHVARKFHSLANSKLRTPVSGRVQ